MDLAISAVQTAVPRSTTTDTRSAANESTPAILGSGSDAGAATAAVTRSRALEAANSAAADQAAKDTSKDSFRVAGQETPQRLQLSIAFNKDAARFVYRDVDQHGNVKRQYPTEEALRRIAYLRDEIDKTLSNGETQGKLVNTTL